MARKHLLANIGERPINPNKVGEKTESRVDYARKGASRSMMQSLDDLAENSLRVLEGETVVSLDPGKLDPSPFADRIGDDDDEYRNLLKAIGDTEQHSPVLVRPHPDLHGRFIIVYGHRRVRVARELNRQVRAVVKPLEDIAHIVAQGQENTARANLSFIEKSLFARRLQQSGIDKSAIRSALTVDDTLLSRMLSVAEIIPDEVLEALGAAKGVGRDRWEELKKLVQVPANADLAQQLIISEAFLNNEVGKRVPFLIEQLKASRSKKPKKSRALEKTWSLSGDAVKVATKDSGGGFTLALKSKDASQFGTFLAERLERLYADFTQQEKEDDQ